MAIKIPIKRLMWIVSIGGVIIIIVINVILSIVSGVGDVLNLLAFTAAFCGFWFLGSWIIYFLVLAISRIVKRFRK